jgi:exopolysaccharide biosynthesis polyprenyl glycosylphosphotransferase
VNPIADTEAGTYLHLVGRHALFLFGLGLPTLEPSSALAATTNNGDELPGWLELTLVVLAAGIALAVLVAVIEMSLRMTRERSGRGEVEAPVLSALYAQRLYARALYGVAPAGVATAIALLRTEEVSTAAFLFAAMVLTGAILRSHRQPLHLMPIARYAFNAFVPAAGIAVAMLPAAFGNSLLAPQTAVVVLVAAVITTLMAAWLENRFEADRPIRLAVIGRPTFAAKLSSELEETGIRGYTVVGYLGEGPPGPDTHADWIGSLDQVRSAVQREGIDLLVIAPQKPRLAVFEQAAKDCLDLAVRMIEATALYEDVLGHVPIGTINSAWFQFIMHPRYSPSSPLSKRVLDLVVSGLMGLASLPLMLLCALAVKLEDRGPVFYRQRRVGEEGREFRMLKFRTMRADADELMESHGEEELVTRVGRALRKTHLNELPQLLQVLKGEMSLVGPRPEPPALVEELSGLVPYYERRALVKPGLTGWAQVRCGYAGSHYGTAWKMCHDLYYIKHRSAQFDLLILVQTLNALLERSGEGEQLPAKDFILGDTVELAGR